MTEQRLPPQTYQTANEIARLLTALPEDQIEPAITQAIRDITGAAQIAHDADPDAIAPTPQRTQGGQRPARQQRAQQPPPPAQAAPPADAHAQPNATGQNHAEQAPAAQNATETAERKAWLKKAVENRWINMARNTIFPLLLTVSPTARVGLEGFNKVINEIAAGRKDKAIKEFGIYAARTGLAFQTLGASELAYGVWKGISSFREKDEHGNYHWKVGGGAKTIAAAAAIGAATWYFAPGISDTILSTAVGTSATKGLEAIGTSSNLFRPELAKAYATVATKMALSNVVSWGGKKVLGENSKSFEAARRITTGVFALEAFGQGLYSTEGSAVTGNRAAPLVGHAGFNLSQSAADLVKEPAEQLHNLIDNTIHAWENGTLTPEEEGPLPPAPATPTPIENFEELQINPDGTVSQSERSETMTTSDTEITPVAYTGEDQEKIEPATYPLPPEGDGMTKLIAYRHEVLDTEGITITDPDDYPIYTVDSNAVHRLETFMHNPDIASIPKPLIQDVADPFSPDADVYQLGQRIPENIFNLSIAEIDGLPEFVIEHSRSVVDDIGSNMLETDSPLLDHDFEFAFEYAGNTVHIPIDMNDAKEAMEANQSLSDFVLAKTEAALRTTDFFGAKIFENPGDHQTTYKVVILEQFTNTLASFAGDVDLIPDLQASKYDFGKDDDKVTFYDEVAARLYDDDPFKAQLLFESRLNTSANPFQFLGLGSEEHITQLRTDGSTIIDLIKSGHEDAIPDSERAVIYDLATSSDGMLNRSNNYFGHRDITAVLQLSDGTVLSFGAGSGAIHEDPDNRFVYDNDPDDSDGSDIVDDLEAQIKAANPGISEADLDARVLEASIKLAEIAETHNFGKQLERIFEANPGVPVTFEADGDQIIETFTLLYEDGTFHIKVANGTEGELTLNDSKLLVEALSKYQVIQSHLSGLNLLGEPSRYEEVIFDLKAILLSESGIVNVPTFFNVNGDPHFTGPITQQNTGNTSAILGFMVGHNIQRVQGYTTHLDSDLLSSDRETVTTAKQISSRPDSEAILADIQKNIDIGVVKIYNPAQLLVLNQSGQYIIQGASRELAERYFENPTAPDAAPVTITLPFTDAGFGKDFTIEFNGGPVNFEKLYSDIAIHINSNLRPIDIEAGYFVDPTDQAFQAYINQHILSGLLPNMEARGVGMEDIIDTTNMYFAVGTDGRLILPISELESISSAHRVPAELLRLSLDNTVGRATSYGADGEPVLTPIGFSPAAGFATTRDGNFWGTLAYTLNSGAAGFREGLVKWLLDIVGSPAGENTIKGVSGFTGAAIEAGIPISRYAADVAAAIPTESSLETADVLYTLKTSLNGIRIGSFAPFTILDPMLAKPLGTLEYMAGMNRGVYPYSVSGVLRNVIDDFQLDLPKPNGTYDLPKIQLPSITQTDSPLGEGLVTTGDEYVYVVQRGDSLAKISRELYGTEKYWPQIYELNKDVVENPRVIFRGEVLRLPSNLSFDK